MGCITDLVVVITTKFCSTARLVISSIFTFFGIAVMWSGMSNGWGDSGGDRKHKQKESKKFVNELLDKNERLERELKEEKNKWTEIFGKEFERKAKYNFNDTSDPSTPTALSEKFQLMYDEEWRNAMMCYKADEKKGIISLSRVLQNCQTFCQDIAKKQLMMFISPCCQGGQSDVTQQPSMNDQLIKLSLSEEEIHNLYKMRRKVGQHESIIGSMIESFKEECLKDEHIKDVINNQESAERNNTDGGNEEFEDNKELIETYIEKCTRLCWQAAISDPPVNLKFDVIGVPFDEVKSKFTKYAGKISPDENDELNHVKYVVWPAVVIKCSENEEVEKVVGDGKGEVIIPESTSI